MKTSMSTRFSPVRDLPAVIWLAATVVAAALHPWIPAPRWLMIHLLLLGAVSHSILVWSRHFADAVLHAPSTATDQRRQSIRLGLLNGGVVLVVTGVLTGWWPVTAMGATGVATAVGWHGAALLHRLRAALPARFGMTVRYYLAATTLLPVGALLGVLMARGVDEGTHERLMVAHAGLNVLGWLGLTVLGTLVTLWPTILRTRIAPGAERAAARALPILVTGLVIAEAGPLSGVLPVTALGLAVYLAGVGMLAVPFVRVARAKPPTSYAAGSVLAAMIWYAGSLLVLVVALGTSSSWVEAHDRLADVTPTLALGFGVQILLGAMSYLMPVVLRGGPSAVRAATEVLDTAGPLRLAVVNGGLLVALPAVSEPVRTLGFALVLIGYAVFLPLSALAARASRAARTSGGTSATTTPGPRPSTSRPRGQGSGLLVTGLAVVLLTVAGGVAIAPTGAPGAAADVVPTGHTTEVAVVADHMRFTPSHVDVPVGDRLVITLRNNDTETVHDLVLDTGADSGRLAYDASARLDVGVVGRDLQGWCSVVGHRQMGMTLDISAVGGMDMSQHAHSSAAASSDAAGASPDSPMLDFMKEPAASFAARSALLPPVGADRDADRVHRQTLTVKEVLTEVSPGVTQKLWTYNGTSPGPVLHGEIGDTFEITLVNAATIGHSIDFHAGALAPNDPMRTIPPGGSLVYRFTATRAGIWMYHCSTMPMSSHIANGMFGAVVIDPPNLPAVAHEYVLTQSELYLGAQGGSVDADKVAAERPDAVVFNGYANQYDHRPLTARVGERVRIWVLDAGPNRSTSFHIVGGQFDTVYAEGTYLLRPGRGGSQALSLAAAQGGFVELAFTEAGRYPFVSHVMVDAERGAHGAVTVTP